VELVAMLGVMVAEAARQVQRMAMAGMARYQEVAVVLALAIPQ
jgi:hypothetical protein